MTNIKTDTIIRTVVLIVAIINQILAIAGKDALPIYESDVTQIVTLAFMVGSAVWAWWKNNSFTKAAIEADDVKDTLKARGELENDENAKALEEDLEPQKGGES